MTSKVGNRPSRNRLILLVFAYIVISLFIGVFHKPRFEVYKPFKLYTINNEIMISNSADTNLIKNLNTLNREFEKKYKGDITVEIQPQGGGAADYKIKAAASTNLSEVQMDSIFKEYVDFIGERNKAIVHISALKYENIPYENLKLKSIVIMVIQGFIIGSAVFLLNSILKTQLSLNRANIFNAIIGFLFVVASLIGGTVIFGVLLFTLYALLKIIDANKDSKKELKLICFTAFITRCGAALLLLILNFYRYGSFYSYLQPDEIFYYSTGDTIYQGLINFKHINLIEITGVGQYGYNLFIGIIKILNLGDVFLTMKAINILVSVLFVAVLFNFVYRKFNNKKIALVSSALMAIMPTFAVFASLALRDIIISFCIFIVFSECVSIESSENKIMSVVKVILSLFFLWYLRKFAALLIIMLTALYFVIKFLLNKKINMLAIITVMSAALYILILVASKLYSFSILNMVKRSLGDVGIFRFIFGIFLSLVNLDFIVNMGDTIYTSTKSLILRFFYPETLLLILTFPIMGLGLIKAMRKYKSLVIVVLLMFICFISIYKIQYGGWFLRTQLQIFPFQYIFIAWGAEELGLLDRLNKWKKYVKTN